MLQVYLAAKFSLKDDIRQKYDELTALGIACTSSWVFEPEDPNVKLEDRDWRVNAELDLDDITESDVLVLFSESEETPTYRNGRLVEFGYALALDKKLAIIGPKENIFMYLPYVEQFDSWKECLEWIKKMNSEK